MELSKPKLKLLNQGISHVKFIIKHYWENGKHNNVIMCISFIMICILWNSKSILKLLILPSIEKKQTKS